MSSSFFKIIFAHGSRYLTASVFASFCSLLMTKYYTQVFSPTEFGILSMYLIMFKYVSTLVSLNLDSSSVRIYFDYKDSQRDEYLSTIFWFITLLAFGVFVVGLFFIQPISNWIAPNTQFIYFITLFSGIFMVYVNFLMNILYNEHKSKLVLKYSILQTVINHLSSAVLISVFKLGLLGRIGGQGLSYGVNSYALIRTFQKEGLFKIKLTFNRLMAKETFLLALPGMMTVLLSVAFIYLDRFFIKHYIGDSAVGIYTLGYTLGQGLSLVYEAVSQAIFPKVYNEMNINYDKARKELESFAYRYYISLIVITILIILLSPVIVSIFSNESYAEAAIVMPLVMVGFMMGGFYKIPALILGFHKIVWFYPFLSIVSFGTNALLNWYFIPVYGITGAAFASFVGLFLYSCVVFVMSWRFFSTGFNAVLALIYSFVFVAVLLAFF